VHAYEIRPDGSFRCILDDYAAKNLHQQPNKLGGNRHDHIPVVLQQERPGYLSTSIALLLAKLIQRARYYME
jgi:hypothetical protein